MLEDLTGLIGVSIPILALLITALAIWSRHQQKVAELRLQETAHLTAEKAAQYAAHTRELEERVRVLERIVTDKGYNVAAQIEALRDTARVEHRATPDA